MAKEEKSCKKKTKKKLRKKLEERMVILLTDNFSWRMRGNVFYSI